MKISTVIGGGIIFIAGIATGTCLVYKTAVKIDEKIYKGKLREKFVAATTETTTSFIREKFEPKRFEPKRFESKPSIKYRRSPKGFIFGSRIEAEDVRLKLNDIIARYGCASIADFYDLVGWDTVYTDNKFGWKEGLSDELITLTANGWTIYFPEVCEL